MTKERQCAVGSGEGRLCVLGCDGRRWIPLCFQCHITTYVCYYKKMCLYIESRIIISFVNVLQKLFLFLQIKFENTDFFSSNNKNLLGKPGVKIKSVQYISRYLTDRPRLIVTYINKLIYI